MNIDELKEAWGQFNNEISKQELIDKQQIKEMLARQRATSYHKLLWYEQISLILISLFFVALCTLTFYWINILPRVNLEIALSVLLLLLIVLGVNIFRYYKLKQAGCMKYNLERQISYILQYKSSIYWSYIITYIAIIPGVTLFIIYTSVFWACIIVTFILLALILDIFIFKHIFLKIEGLLDTNKELRELKEIMHEN